MHQGLWNGRYSYEDALDLDGDSFPSHYDECYFEEPGAIKCSPPDILVADGQAPTSLVYILY